MHPRTYNEARTIGEHFREGIPVIINLTDMDDADAVPQSARAAIKLLVGAWYENREAVEEKAPVEVPLAVRSLLASLEVRDYRLE